MLQPVIDELDLDTTQSAPAGPAPHNPSELLDSERMRQVVHALTHRYDAVIIDTPALLPVTDAAIAAHHTGAAIHVVGAGHVDKAQPDEALAMLDGVDAQVRQVPTANRSQKSCRYNYSLVTVASGRQLHLLSQEVARCPSRFRRLASR